MTKRELFERLLNMESVQQDNELVEGLTHEIELLNRKNTGSKKASKVTEELKDLIYSTLSEYDEPIMIKQLINDNDELEGFTSQKIVPIMKALETDGKVQRVVIRRNAHFKVIG